MADIVLVPGSHHGGWYFAPLLPALRAAGHRVFPLTPTGVGDRRHLTNGAINLDTHVQDLVNLVEMENVDNAVLVGHSYGGMVITGGSSRLPGRVRAMVHLDGLLPQDGQRAWDLIIEPVRQRFLATTEDGLSHLPSPELGERLTAPLGDPPPADTSGAIDVRRAPQGVCLGTRQSRRRHLRGHLSAPVARTRLADAQGSVRP